MVLNREAEGEDRSPADLALDLDSPIVLLDDPVADGQAEPGPRAFGGEEGVEQFIDILPGHTHARIGETDLDPLPVGGQGVGDGELAALRHGLAGVEHAVRETMPD